MIYLDTSVLAALYFPEPLSTQVQRLCSAAQGAAISALSEVEFHSAVARRVRAGELAKQDALRVLALFRAHVDDGFYCIIAISDRDYALARDWLASFRTPLRALDALHLAVASSAQLAVATADRVLAKSARYLHVECRLLS